MNPLALGDSPLSYDSADAGFEELPYDLTELEALLPSHVQRQRWFGGEENPAEQIRIRSGVMLEDEAMQVCLLVIELDHDRTYLLPLGTARGQEAADLLKRRPTATITWVGEGQDRALLYDATVDPGFWLLLFNAWPHTKSFLDCVETAVSAQVMRTEQSNASAIVTTDSGREVFVKLYRRIEAGINPEVQVLGHLTETNFRFVPKLLGVASLTDQPDSLTIAIMQEGLHVDGNGWTYALDHFRQFLNRISALTTDDDVPPPAGYVPPKFLEAHAPELLSLAHALGSRTAELHRALRQADTPGIHPLTAEPSDIGILTRRIREEAEHTRMLIGQRPDLFGDAPNDDDWERTFDHLDALEHLAIPAMRIRVHGDYHLGQVIHANGVFYILDFEGEPTRSLIERGRHDFAIRDVAGMIRSFDYAGYAALAEYEDPTRHLYRHISTLIHWCEVMFVEAYYKTAGDADFLLPEAVRPQILRLYLLDKALYETRYEISHRPRWTHLPLRSLRRLMRTT